MSAQTTYNGGRDFKRGFNQEQHPTFNDADEASRKCQERIEQLIDATKRELNNEGE
jgi:hypothetical protein